jgi:hypothetical protein
LAVDPSGSWAIYISSREPKRHVSESQARSLLEMVVYEDEVALLECSQVAGEQRAPKRRRRECFIIMEQGGADGFGGIINWN